MISHKYKCIYIHIPCTAGTALEQIIDKRDWWGFNSSHKHLTACQSKKLYKEYWEEYFKFGFVRDPFARHASISKFQMFRGDNDPTSKVSTSTISKCIKFYKSKFGVPLTGEYDFRFDNDKSIPPRNTPIIENSVYQNIYNEQLDFIGKVENLQRDLFFVFDKIKLSEQTIPSFKPHANNKYLDMYTDQLRQEVENLYKKDIIYFDY
jgi:hypothetical protein